MKKIFKYLCYCLPVMALAVGCTQDDGIFDDDLVEKNNHHAIDLSRPVNVLVQQGRSLLACPGLERRHLHGPGSEQREKSQNNQQTDEYFFQCFDDDAFLNNKVRNCLKIIQYDSYFMSRFAQNLLDYVASDLRYRIFL